MRTQDEREDLDSDQPDQAGRSGSFVNTQKRKSSTKWLRFINGKSIRIHHRPD